MIRLKRSGSVTLMAIVVMVVLSIVVMVYNWIGQSTHRMLHHTYYNEKVLAIFEGLDVIARGVVQSDAALSALLEKDPGKSEDITARVVDRMDQFGLLGEGQEGATGVLAKKFKEYLKVEASLKNLQKMPDIQSIKSAGEKDAKLPKALEKVGSPEVMGRVAIRIRLSDNIQLHSRMREGKEESSFTIPKRDVTMEYEFKRARVIPPYFRHFALWVKEGIKDEEKPEDYESKGNFNFAQNPLTGKSASYGVLFVRAGPGRFFGVGGDFSGAGMSNAFKTDTGYIYLGGKEKARAHLNLMAGDVDKSAPYSETFHLYRGATTDFYKVWSTEFSNFIEKSEVQQPGKDAPSNPQSSGWLQRSLEFFGSMVKNAIEWLKGAVRRALDLDNLEQGNKNLADSNALPLYYVVRKDYGYATEWGEASYQRFGFARGGGQQASTQTIWSSSLHLYGSNSDGPNLGVHDPSDPNKYLADDFAAPTIVLGNVYRRCLSLSGYKQRRKGDPKGTELPSSDRKFEVQAGPIEFFDGYTDLMNRSQDPTQGKEKKPIWVWDARVRWNMEDSGGTGSSEGSGTYLPISGAALFGRLIPGLAKLWDKNNNKFEYAKQLFEKTVAPPEETADASKGINAAHQSDVNDNTPEFAVGISPLFQLLGDRKFFDAGKHPLKAADGYLFGGVTPYFEELLRCFSYTVSGLGDVEESIKKIQPTPTGAVAEAVRAALKGGKERWSELTENPDTHNQFKVKDIKASEIEDKKMAKYWQIDGPKAPKFFPFSLPDVWDNRTPCAKENFRDYFEKQWVNRWPVDKARTPADFFKLYFTPLMTNPARVLPYNYSLRFICTDLREIFSLPPKERRALLMDKFPAEVTDGIGYIESDENAYLNPEQYNEVNDMPLNDAVLGNIFKARKDKKRLQSAYYFMDEYGESVIAKGTPSPGDPKTEDCFFERSFWQNKGPEGGAGEAQGSMTWDEASRRFLSPQPDGNCKFYLNTILGLADGAVKWEGMKALVVNGAGAVIVPGTLDINTDFLASKPVFLVAEKINIGGNAKIVQAGLIAHKSISLSGSTADTLYIDGNVVAGEWDKSSFTKSGKRVIAYNKEFKTADLFITNIEPRIRKYSSQEN